MNFHRSCSNTVSSPIIGHSVSSPFLSSSHDSEASSRNQASRNSDSTRLSLTHFLDRKLHNSSTVPQTVPGKLTPFQSPASEQDGSVKLTDQVGTMSLISYYVFRSLSYASLGNFNVCHYFRFFEFGQGMGHELTWGKSYKVKAWGMS
ncbi:unnamed protein product [Vicia faba]|uniref:Uncharacterized protein n=1 Tax=Vicia faba TaxID=3906 RepID=A0AAV0ZT48_VICFA|nr:unnamed protein product [Vicia faba]